MKRITYVGRPAEMTINNETHSTAFFIAIRDRERYLKVNKEEAFDHNMIGGPLLGCHTKGNYWGAGYF